MQIVYIRYRVVRCAANIGMDETGIRASYMYTIIPHRFIYLLCSLHHDAQMNNKAYRVYALTAYTIQTYV